MGGATARVGSTPDVVRLLATRDGKAFYATRSASGQPCVGVADAAVAALSFEQLQCTRGGAAFPSPTVPVLQTSPVYGREGSNASSCNSSQASPPTASPRSRSPGLRASSPLPMSATTCSTDQSMDNASAATNTWFARTLGRKPYRKVWEVGEAGWIG